MDPNVSDSMPDKEIEAAESTGEVHLISRRAFLAGTAATVASMGFMAYLPRVPGGYLVPASNLFGPSFAYAATGDAHFTLTVVGADQVGFHVVDVSTLDASGNGTPVSRAKIKVISRADSSKYVEGETDDKGDIIFDIGSLALLDENGNLLQGIYQFNATVQVDGSKCRPAMRDFTAGLVHVEGASGIIIAVHSYEDDDDDYGYIERFGFDDWDILYTKSTLYRSAENKAEHWVTVRVKNPPEAILGSKLTAKFKEKIKKNGKYTGEEKDRELSFSPKKSDYDAQSNTYTAMFTGNFLQQGGDNCFNADEVKLTFEYPVAKKKRKVTTTLYTQEAPIQGTVFKSPLTPFLTGNSVLASISSSNDWPVFNNANISIINWDWPVKLFATPNNVMLCIGTAPLLTGDDGTVEEWQKHTEDSLKERYNNARKRYAKNIDKLGKSKPFEGENNQAVSHQWAGRFSLNLVMGLVFGIQFAGFKGEGLNVSKYFEGQVCAGIGLDLKGSASFRFAIASIPFYITITAGLELMFAGTFVVTAELIGEQDLRLNDITWVPNGSLSINIKPSFKLSVGVGIEGAVSVSVSGCIALPMFIGWLEAKPSPDADDTHFTVGYTFKAELSAQVACFSGSVVIWSKAEDPFYNNWNTAPPLPEATNANLWGESAGARFLHTLPDGTKGHTTVLADDGRLLAGNGTDILDGLLPVTMDDMGYSYEVEATKPKQPANYSEDELPDVHRNMIPMVVELEDGSLVTQFVPCEGVNTFTFTDELASTVVGLESEDAQANKQSGAADGDEDANVVVAAATASDGGESPEAGAGEEDGWSLVGDPFLGFGAPADAEYEYENVPGKTTGAVCGSGGVASIGLYDGIKPNVDVVIYNEVFSDPHQKIVNINGVPCLFRIMTVDYTLKGKQPVRRPRVVCSMFDLNTKTWGDPKVIEYSSGNNKLKRIDMFDYDFDIVARSAGTSWTRHVEACLVVTGGLRPQGDGTSIYEAFATPTVAVVFLDENLDVFQRTVKQASDLYEDGLSHMVYNPRVRDGFAAGGASGAVAFAFLHRSAADPTALMSTDAEASFGLGYCYLRDGAVAVALKAGRIIDPDSDTPIYVDPVELDHSVTSMDIIVGNGVKGKYDALLTLLFCKSVGYEVYSALIPCGKSFADIQVKHNITSSATLPQIAAWPGHGTVLFTKHRDPDRTAQASDYYLYAGVFDPNKENQPGFESSYERVDFNGIKGSSFAVSPTGNYLFYYESFNGNPGDDIVPDKDDPTKVVHVPCHVEIYRIMASRYINGAFSEDFPFAELDSPIDSFEVMNITNDASTFLATEITDADRSVGRLRYIAVPNTLSAEVEAFDPFDPFACAGKTCSFQADIRNHGNMVIGGFDIAMFDADGGMAMVGEPFSVQTIDRQRVLTTATSRRPWMDDVQVPAEQAYAAAAERVQNEPESLTTMSANTVPVTEIMPGEVLSYRVDFDIPASWRGEREVVLRIINAWSPGVQVAMNEAPSIEAGAPISAMLASSEGPIALHLHEGARGTLAVDAADADAELIDPLEELVNDDDSWTNPDVTPDINREQSSEPARTSGSSGSSSSGSVPRTGDPIPGFAVPIVAALGGFGALMAAYSARRLRNERQQGNDDIDLDDATDE